MKTKEQILSEISMLPIEWFKPPFGMMDIESSLHAMQEYSDQNTAPLKAEIERMNTEIKMLMSKIPSANLVR
jgi:hypothetical protein